MTITNLEPIAMVAEAREDIELVSMGEMEIDVNISKINLGGEEINVVSSRDIAEELNRNHRDVLKSIDEIIGDDSVRKSSQPLIIPSTYIHPQNKQEYREYLLTKDGFTLYMFNIQGHNDFKMAYINKFNEMEQAIRNPFKNMSKELQSILLLDSKTQELNKKIDTVATDFNDFKDNETLSPAMMKAISDKVKRLGVQLLGGKASTAYRISNGHYRRMVISDIYNQLKREFGIDAKTSYMFIKRKDLQEAMDFLDTYKLPARLEEEIRDINTQLEMEV